MQGALAIAPPRGRAVAISRLGLLALALLALALLVLPFAHLQPNRIVSGVPVRLWAVPDALFAAAAAGGLLLCGLLGAHGRRPALALVALAVGVIALPMVAGLAASRLLPPGQSFARVSLGAGFWLALLALGVLAAEQAQRLRLSPVQRGLAALTLVVAGLAVLASGVCNDLSILKEYRSNRDAFAREAWHHAWLVGASVVPAVLAGIPLGIAAHRSRRFSGLAMPVLDVVQTIPSMALFGLLIAPLGALAAAAPWLAALGVAGVGWAPAVVALFLYALLPVVANTRAGFAGVDPAVIDAARGMGMTRAGRLAKVELPLALPVILSGIRIVLVQNIGLAAVAALIGGGGLGVFVFRGMGQTAIDLVLLGVVPIVVFSLLAAILLDAAADYARKAVS